MGKALYVGVSSKAHKGKKAYIGVDGKARKIKKMYIGDANGKARLFWSGGGLIAFCYDKKQIVSFDESVSGLSYSEKLTWKASSKMAFAFDRYWSVSVTQKNEYVNNQHTNVSYSDFYYSYDGITWTKTNINKKGTTAFYAVNGILIANHCNVYTTDGVTWNDFTLTYPDYRYTSTTISNIIYGTAGNKTGYFFIGTHYYDETQYTDVLYTPTISSSITLTSVFSSSNKAYIGATIHGGFLYIVTSKSTRGYNGSGTTNANDLRLWRYDIGGNPQSTNQLLTDMENLHLFWSTDQYLVVLGRMYNSAQGYYRKSLYKYKFGDALTVFTNSNGYSGWASADGNNIFHPHSTAFVNGRMFQWHLGKVYYSDNYGSTVTSVATTLEHTGNSSYTTDHIVSGEETNGFYIT